MEAHKKTKAVLNRHLREACLGPQIKVAEFSPEQFKPKNENNLGDGGGNFLKRAIPKNFPYDPKALKPLAQTLWAMSVALGHTLTAHRQLSKIKSSTISPDGLIGGQGYVMSIKEVRKALYNAAEGLSAISDTLHDEINAPHWKPRLAELEKNDIESVERLVGEAEENLENPEEEALEEMEEAEEEGPRADLDEEEGGSELPTSGGQTETPDASGEMPKQASQYSYSRCANSSIPVQTESGPRVQHLDRGDVDQTGPFGSYNNQEPMSVHDDWSQTEGVPDEYAYQSEWDNELEDPTSHTGESVMPGKNTDPTPTEGYDFGVGYGDGNDAHGQGAGDYGTVGPDGKSVYGPSSEMPDDPATGTGVGDDVSTLEVELAVGRQAQWKTSASMLPLDIMPSVARTDYYEGNKEDNEVNAATTEEEPATSLPDEEPVNYEFPKDLHPGVGYRYERGRQPYIKWDSDTHNMKYDHVYQREDQGPFEREG